MAYYSDISNGIYSTADTFSANAAREQPVTPIRIIAFLGLFIHIFTSSAVAELHQQPAGLREVIAAVESRFRSPQGQQTGWSGFSPGSMSSASATETYAQPFTDVTAAFFQRTYLKSEDRDLRGDGEISFKPQTESSPLMFRISYYRPLPHEIVSNGRDMWIYHPANRQVILSNVGFLFTPNRIAYERDRAINFLHGIGQISRDFQIDFAEGTYDKDGNYVLELNPRKPMLSIRRIFLVVSKDVIRCDQFYKQLKRGSQNKQDLDYFARICTQGPFQQPPFPILSSTVYDHKGNFTTIELTNVRTNMRIPDIAFEFMIPAGAEVVRPSEHNLPR